MQNDWAGRRAYPRLKMNLPVRFGIIDIKGRRRPKARFSGETINVSMKGLEIGMSRRIPHMLPIAIEMMGNSKKYDLEIRVDLSGVTVWAVGEVKWSLMEIPHLLKMGVSIKGMRHEEEGKWTSFIERQYQESPHKIGPASSAIESIQRASNHLNRASNRILQQIKAYEAKQEG